MNARQSVSQRDDSNNDLLSNAVKELGGLKVLTLMIVTATTAFPFLLHQQQQSIAQEQQQFLANQTTLDIEFVILDIKMPKNNDNN
jgi:hypothetical protein